MKKKIKDIIRFVHIAYLRCRTLIRPQIKLDGVSLFIAPHPDDEAIGCGGLINHLCSQGNPPHVIILTGGGNSMCNGKNPLQPGQIFCDEIITKRRELTLESARKIGLPENHIHFLDFQDGNISDRPESEMLRLVELIEKIKPSAIFVPHWGEGWPDHIVTREILLSHLGVNSEKGLEDNNSSLNFKHSTLTVFKNPQIFEYCVWMWYYNVWKLNWEKAYKFRMSHDEHQSKLEAIDAYIRPLAPNGKPWSGNLPKPFIFANTMKTELYFEIYSK